MNSRFIKLSTLAISILLFTVNSKAQIDYKTKIQTIWSSKGCISCHGGNGGLYIDTYKSLMTTGDHKPLVLSKDTNSTLVKKLRGTANFGSRMPFGGPYLLESEMNTINQWIKEGATETATTGISTLAENNFVLNQNYPNPFNPSTKIEYRIPENTSVIVKVYDTNGKETETLVSKEQSAGIYSVNWYPKNLTSGVYFYKIQAGKYSETKKMLYLR